MKCGDLQSQKRSHWILLIFHHQRVWWHHCCHFNLGHRQVNSSPSVTFSLSASCSVLLFLPQYGIDYQPRLWTVPVLSSSRLSWIKWLIHLSDYYFFFFFRCLLRWTSKSLRHLSHCNSLACNQELVIYFQLFTGVLLCSRFPSLW